MASCTFCFPCQCRCAPAPKSFASFSQVGHTLTDADVERVAKRVVELLAEKLTKL